MPSIITFDVTTQNGQTASVNVLPGWRALFSVLKIELTDFNMQLLLEDPPAGSAPYPQIDQGNLFWVPNQNKVRCYWRYSKEKQWRVKSSTVVFEPGMDEEQKDAAVASATKELEQFLQEHEFSPLIHLWLHQPLTSNLD